MPYQINLIIENNYNIKKNNWFYSLYYDIKSLFISNNTYYTIKINIVNSQQEAIYELFQYLYYNNYGGLKYLYDDITSGLYDANELLFLNKTYQSYDELSNIDRETYFNDKLINFLVDQTHSIHDIDITCDKYCDSSYKTEWDIELEFTE
jgi:hypothetical protein